MKESARLNAGQKLGAKKSVTRPCGWKIRSIELPTIPPTISPVANRCAAVALRAQTKRAASITGEAASSIQRQPLSIPKAAPGLKTSSSLKTPGTMLIGCSDK